MQKTFIDNNQAIEKKTWTRNQKKINENITSIFLKLSCSLIKVFSYVTRSLLSFLEMIFCIVQLWTSLLDWSYL
jgi:hypothetical protein